MATIFFFGKIDRSWETWKYTNGSGALGYMNNVDFEEKKLVNDNIVLDVLIICQKLRHILSN